MERESRKIFPFFLLLLFISLFLFLADNFGWLVRIKGVVTRPILTLEKPIYSVYQSAQRSVSQLTDRSANQRVVELQTQLRQLAVEQNQLTTCLEENEHLKKLLGAPLSSDWQFKMARVVGLTEKMRIDLGVSEGIEKGMTVVSENVYLGQIVFVGERDSLVQLPTDPDSKIPVVIKKPGSPGVVARGLLAGQFGGKLLLDRVLQEEDIRQGDLVVTSGEEGYLPDLVIGQIKEIKKGTAEVYQQASVSPFVDYSSLRFVFIVFP
jgi:rod shape-determining protein MreC